MPRLLLTLFFWSALAARAHTLPISYLMLVPDAEYLHVELTLNPFELASFSEMDMNRNGRFDPDELEAQADKITRLLLENMTLRVDGKTILAENAGISPDADSHHATLRAHYRVDARRAALTLESTLRDITSSSHLSQVNFLRDGKPQLAQLDSQSHKATFNASTRVVAGFAPPYCKPTRAPASGRNSMIVLGMAIAIVSFIGLRQMKRNITRIRPASTHPQH